MVKIPVSLGSGSEIAIFSGEKILLTFGALRVSAVKLALVPFFEKVSVAKSPKSQLLLFRPLGVSGIEILSVPFFAKVSAAKSLKSLMFSSSFKIASRSDKTAS